jgi:hypothetical protein
MDNGRVRRLLLAVVQRTGGAIASPAPLPTAGDVRYEAPSPSSPKPVLESCQEQRAYPRMQPKQAGRRSIASHRAAIRQETQPLARPRLSPTTSHRLSNSTLGHR